MVKKSYFTSALSLTFALALTACANKPVVTAVDSDRNPANSLMLELPEGAEAVMETLPDSGGSVVTLTENTYSMNPNCGGKSLLSRHANSKLYLQITGSKCSNVKNGNTVWKLHGTGNTNRWIDVEILESIPGRVEVLLGSNNYIESSGHKGDGDTIYINIAPKKTYGFSTYDIYTKTNYKFKKCKGSLKANVGGGQLNLVVKNTDAKTFDIVKADDAAVGYPQKKIQNKVSSSFTISPKFYEYGKNQVMVHFACGYDTEKVLVKFYAQ